MLDITDGRRAFEVLSTDSRRQCVGRRTFRNDTAADRNPFVFTQTD